ncbi:pilus assembly protein [Enterobacteriaceae bacterium ESL0689]|nr:pilus assembly protein [Enterobacteriaceae bacterium ESL0689]
MLLKKLKTTLRHQFYIERGTAAVEFSLVLIPFLLSIFFIIELCRIVFISSAVDLIIAESGNVAAVTTVPDRYQTYFNSEIDKRMKSWPLISRDTHVKVSLQWCNDIDAVINDSCSQSSVAGNSEPLAFYNMEAEYKPLFFFFPQQSIDKMLNRRILLVQEHELARDNND